MTWFKVDDGFADHPKVIALQASKHWKGALALWTLAGSWSSRHLTDGHVPSAVVTRLGCAPHDALALVEAGLWDQVDGGYRFHGWEERNPSREAVEADRAATRERVQRHRTGKGLKAQALAKCGSSCHYCGAALSLSSMTMDHVIPRKNGGETEIGNVVAACLGCNSSKSNGTLVTRYQCACNALPTRSSPTHVTAPRPDPTRPVLLNGANAPVALTRDRAPVLEIFEHWKAATGKGRAKLDTRRRTRIEWALANYAPDEVKRAIDGYAASAWHRGDNDRGRAFLDLTLMLRDAEHVERGLEMASGKSAMASTTSDKRTLDAWLAELSRLEERAHEMRLAGRREEAERVDARRRETESAGPERWQAARGRANGSGAREVPRGDHSSDRADPRSVANAGGVGAS